ncbi:MAG: GntR family transcriptional regulator [Fervidobacterium sp.]|nr:GntR family transcriptional regulator [Fervidobacterium sp.]
MIEKIPDNMFCNNFKKVDKHSGVPAYLQIVNQIKTKIMTGQLSKGMQLPPVRELQNIFDVNVNTILKALERLKFEGIVEARQGIGYFISENIPVQEMVIESIKKLVRSLKDKNIDLYTTIALIEEVWRNE